MGVMHGKPWWLSFFTFKANQTVTSYLPFVEDKF